MTATLRAGIVSIGWLVVPVAVASETPESPHGRPDACDDCHSGPPSASNVDLAVTACRECHPTADMHPVNVAPVAAVIPEGWPLHDGQVVCSTCHAEPSCGPGRMQEAPYWRGGPAARTREFCDRCHEPVRFERTNPHHPAVADNTDPSCAACHVRAPREGAAALRTDAPTLCGNCHQGHVHAGVAEHVGATPDPAPEGLTLVDGRIACITCHDVHDETPVPALRSRLGTALRAVFAEREWATLLPDPASWPANEEATPLLARPVHDDALCASCHGDLP
jgi:hypothetical protein